MKLTTGPGCSFKRLTGIVPEETIAAMQGIIETLGSDHPLIQPDLTDCIVSFETEESATEEPGESEEPEFRFVVYERLAAEPIVTVVLSIDEFIEEAWHHGGDATGAHLALLRDRISASLKHYDYEG